MYKIGDKEIKAVTKVIRSGKLFRYQNRKSECDRFEERWAKYIGVKHARMTPSGTEALRAGLIGLAIGPGDEVIVPSHTYMASALAVLAVGAIPVIVDIDESLTLCPKAVEKAISPHTRAIMPVHIWGLSCDMQALMRIARKHKLFVIEDACQSVGGGYEGRKTGAIGHVGCFSFNYFKNMTCGEGGIFVTNKKRILQVGQCVNECCDFYWTGKKGAESHFASAGSRASEFEGAILNVQLSRIEPMIRSMRRQKQRILKKTRDTGLTPVRANSLDHECGTHVGYLLPTAEAAEKFCSRVKGFIAGKTGRHVYTEWLPVMNCRGAHHPAMDPFKMKENKDCQMNYSNDMCSRSLDILNRAVMIPTFPGRKRDETSACIEKIRRAAKAVL